MSLRLIETEDGPAVVHTERLFAFGLAIVLFGVSYWVLSLFCTAPPAGKSSLAISLIADEPLFAVMAIILGIAAPLYCLFLTSPLIVMHDGTIIRKFFGLNIKKALGTPLFFKVTTYKHTFDSGVKELHDLLLVGPLGSYTVTIRGNKQNFVEIAIVLSIPIKNA